MDPLSCQPPIQIEITDLAHGVEDVPVFVRVAYSGNAGYVGGLIGLVGALVYLRRLLRTGSKPAR